MTEKLTTDIDKDYADDIEEGLLQCVEHLLMFIHEIEFIEDNFTESEIKEIKNFKSLREFYLHAGGIINAIHKALDGT